MSNTIHDPPASTTPLPTLLRAAVDRGVISEEQARAVLALDDQVIALPDSPAGEATEQGHAGALVAEAVGYAGAALATVAAAILLDRTWDDLLPGVRVAIPGLLALGLLFAGWVSRAESGPIERLRGFLWAAGTAAAAATTAVVLTEYTGVGEELVAVGAGLTAAALGTVLWQWRVAGLQQLVVLAGLLVTVSAGIAWWDSGVDEVLALAVWALGVAWAVAAWAGVVRPAGTGIVAGSAIGMFGPFMSDGGGFQSLLALGLVTAAAVIVISVPARRLALLGVGVAGIFLYVPRLVFEVFGDALGAPLSLLVTGVLLVGLALMIGLRHPAVRGSE